MSKASSRIDPEAKRRLLRRNKRIAGGLLLLAALIALATRFSAQQSFAIRLISAAAEAAIVGGLADWFAVTALFRRPLGLPIPHTALIPARKNDLGRSMGIFIRDRFLDPALLVERLRRRNHALQFAQWLESDEAANFIAARAAAIVPVVLNGVDDAQIRDFLRRLAQESLRRIDIAPMLDAALGAFLRDGKHMELVDIVIDMAKPSLAAMKKPIVARVGERTGRFFPLYFDKKIGEGIVGGTEKWLDAVRDPASAERARMDIWIREHVAAFRASADYADLMARAQSAIAGNPALLHGLGAIWDSIKRELLNDVGSPSPKIGVLCGAVVRTTGSLLRQMPAMQDHLNAALEHVLVQYISPWRAQIADYIADVVAGWDGREVADIVELQVGSELQYIRINGTLVGALIGSGLFLAGAALSGAAAFP